MKFAFQSLLVTVLALGLSQLAAAQMGMSAPDFAGVFTPVVGSGAAYEMTREAGESTPFEISVVGKEGSAYWIEYSMKQPHTDATVYLKNLTERQGDDVIMKRSILQAPGRPPMDMSSMMKMHPMQSAQSKADMRAEAENLGVETITTPAGTFSCQHWRSKKDGSNYWLSDKITPWKLVKMSGKDQTMTLTRVITDAKTHITGTPVSMEEMMRQRRSKPE